MFTMLYKHHHYLIAEHFHLPIKKPCAVNSLNFAPISPIPWQQVMYFLSV